MFNGREVSFKAAVERTIYSMRFRMQLKCFTIAKLMPCYWNFLVSYTPILHFTMHSGPGKPQCVQYRPVLASTHTFLVPTPDLIQQLIDLSQTAHKCTFKSSWTCTHSFNFYRLDVSKYRVRNHISVLQSNATQEPHRSSILRLIISVDLRWWSSCSSQCCARL